MQKIRIDFDNLGLPQHISAVENDSQSRFFQATLYENGKAYTAPEGATYSIMYRGFGPQNQGWYDTINDGAGKRAACAVSGNVVTCEIARQALQVPGHVSIVLCVTTGKGYMLKSWPIECDCKNDRYDSTAEIQSFFYITQISNADWTQAIQAWENLKDTIDPTLSVSGKAADAKVTGERVGSIAFFNTAALTEPYDDCNTLPNNCKVWYNSAIPKNAPIKNATFLSIFCFNGSPDKNTGGDTQIACADNKIYLRQKNSSWGMWSDISDDKASFSETPTAPYNDCDTLPVNCRVWYTKPNFPANCPTTNTDFISIFCFNGYTGDNTGVTQVAYTANSICVRQKDASGWTTWSDISSGENVKYNTLIKTHFNSTNPVFYGDSITAPSEALGAGNDYPSVFCEKLGISTHDNYAIPGATFEAVLNEIKNFNSNDAIFIACGINDCAIKVPLSKMNDNIKKICDYLNSNHPTIPVYFILPIKSGGDIYLALAEYVNNIAETVLSNDVYNHFSIINGYSFNFPNYKSNLAFIEKVFQGPKNVHPNEYGVRNIYVPSLIQAVKQF